VDNIHEWSIPEIPVAGQNKGMTNTALRTYRLAGYKTGRTYGIVENMLPLSNGEIIEWDGKRFEVMSTSKPTGLVTYEMAMVRKLIGSE
jgi:hypothetical protein